MTGYARLRSFVSLSRRAIVHPVSESDERNLTPLFGVVREASAELYSG